MNNRSRMRAGWGAALVLMSVSLLAHSSDTLNVSDVQVKVRGAVTEGACMLDMASSWQQIDLGQTATSALRKPGDRGQVVPIVMNFRYCIRMHGSSVDQHKLTRNWDAVQPVVTVSFIAPGDADNSQLVKLTGTKGVGLRITDAQQNDVRLGQRGIPQFATPDSSELIYYVALERTRAPLVTGSYQAVVNFFLEYD